MIQALALILSMVSAEVVLGRGHSGELAALDLDATGTTLVTAGGRELILWDLARRRAVRTLAARESTRDVCFTAGGAIVATDGATVVAFDRADGRELARKVVPGWPERVLPIPGRSAAIVIPLRGDPHLFDVGVDAVVEIPVTRELAAAAAARDHQAGGAGDARGSGAGGGRSRKPARAPDPRGQLPAWLHDGSRGPSGAFQVCGLGPQGRSLYVLHHRPRAIGTDETILSILSTRDGRLQGERALLGLAESARCLAVGPSGEQVIVASGGEVLSYSVAPDPRGERVALTPRRAFAHAGGVLAAELSPDGRRLVTTGGPSGWSASSAREEPSRPGVAVWDAQTLAPISRHPLPRESRALAISADGQRFAAGGADVFELMAGHHLFALAAVDDGERQDVAFGAEGRELVIGSRTGKGLVLALDSGTPARELRELTAVARIPASSTLVLGVLAPGGDEPRGLVILDTTAGVVTATAAAAPPGENVVGVATSPSGSILAAPGAMLRLFRYDGARIRPLAELPPLDGGRVAFSPDERTAYTLQGEPPTLTAFELETGRALWSEQPAGVERGRPDVLVATEGRIILAGAQALYEWGLEERAVLRSTRTGPLAPGAPGLLTPDGRRLLLAGAGGDLLVVALDRMEVETLRRLGAGPPRSWDVSPTGRLLALAPASGPIELIRLPELERVASVSATSLLDVAIWAPGPRLLVTPRAAGRAHLAVGTEALPLATGSLELARADALLEGLGVASPEALELHRRLWETRAARGGLAPRGVHASVVLRGERPPPTTTAARVRLELEARGGDLPFRVFQVVVGGVPLPPVPPSRSDGRASELDLDVLLAPGPNTIEVSAIDARGHQSTAEVVELERRGPASGARSWFLGIATSTTTERASTRLGAPITRGRERGRTLGPRELGGDRLTTALRPMLGSRPEDRAVLYLGGGSELRAKTELVVGGISLDDLAARLAHVPARRRLILAELCVKATPEDVVLVLLGELGRATGAMVVARVDCAAGGPSGALAEAAIATLSAASRDRSGPGLGVIELAEQLRRSLSTRPGARVRVAAVPREGFDL